MPHLVPSTLHPAGIKKLLNGTAASAAAASRPSPAVAAANAGRTDTMRKLGFTRPRAHVPKFPGAAAAAATISYPVSRLGGGPATQLGARAAVGCCCAACWCGIAPAACLPRHLLAHCRRCRPPPLVVAVQP